MGWDIAFVRQQLGHDDYRSIERYISIVKNEEVALRMQPPAGADAGGKDQAPGSPVLDEMEISKIRGEIASRNPDAVLLNGLDAAIIGVTVGDSPRAVYGMETMLSVLSSEIAIDGDVPEEEAQDEALEHLDYNILGGLPQIDERVRPVIVDTSIIGRARGCER